MEEISSRRDALKKGALAAGVGAAAVSTPGVASFGVAPRFASAMTPPPCTPVIDLAGGVRNTTSDSACSGRSIQISGPSPDSDAGLTLDPQAGGPTSGDKRCVDLPISGVFSAPPSAVSCTLELIYLSPQGAEVDKVTTMVAMDGTFTLSPANVNLPSNTQYTFIAICDDGSGLPPCCIDGTNQPVGCVAP